MNEPWVAAAITSDVLVAELLLRLKQRSSSSSPSSSTKPNSPLLSPIGWGDRKSRSKPSVISTGELGKGQNQQQQRSPSTPLPWSGGGGGGGLPATASDGYDNEYKSYNRPSDLYRSTKIDLHQSSKREDNGFGRVLCKAESENKINERRFVLPDLNETPTLEG